jgi:hypothetical protein
MLCRMRSSNRAPRLPPLSKPSRRLLRESFCKAPGVEDALAKAADQVARAAQRIVRMRNSSVARDLCGACLNLKVFQISCCPRMSQPELVMRSKVANLFSDLRPGVCLATLTQEGALSVGQTWFKWRCDSCYKAPGCATCAWCPNGRHPVPQICGRSGDRSKLRRDRRARYMCPYCPRSKCSVTGARAALLPPASRDHGLSSNRRHICRLRSGARPMGATRHSAGYVARSFGCCGRDDMASRSDTRSSE